MNIAVPYFEYLQVLLFLHLAWVRIAINILANKCTSYYNTHDIRKLLHVATPR
jgi:hypothetical protein